MTLKDTSILIPEIPHEWTQRTRSGDTNIWNDPFYKNGLPEVRLDPPVRGLYAERLEDGWYWVCGCHTCLENNEPYSYIVCDEHNRCVSCHTDRSALTQTPWGHPQGFQCAPCHEKAFQLKKEQAIRLAQENGHSEDDCMYTTTILCPVCATEYETEDLHEESKHEFTCSVCACEFVVEIVYEVRYTSTRKER